MYLYATQIKFTLSKKYELEIHHNMDILLLLIAIFYKKNIENYL